tara:strand:+ start:467 stop:592 length:126 start_codon:yes stop_codon:yes gene_type:complete
MASSADNALPGHPSPAHPEQGTLKRIAVRILVRIFINLTPS